LLGVRSWLLGAASSQITVRIAPKNEEAGLADVLLKSLGLTGVMVVIAIVAGLIMAAVLFYWRSRKPLDH
jgi:subtilase family serine protease